MNSSIESCNDFFFFSLDWEINSNLLVGNLTPLHYLSKILTLEKYFISKFINVNIKYSIINVII